MPGTGSTLALDARREMAYDSFAKGHTITDVAELVQVTYDTAARYKKEWRDRIKQEADENPAMLGQVIENTIQALQENDLVRKHAWADYAVASEGRVAECSECEAEIVIPSSPNSVKNQFLKTILTAQEQRSKLYGLFGVKAEFFAMVQQVRTLQEKLLEFMRRSLCADCRRKMVEFMREEGAVPDVPSIPSNLLQPDA